MPPIIEAASPEMSITISEPAILVCLITGYPRPSVTWRKNSEVFSKNSARVTIFDEVVNSGNFSGISGGFNGSISIVNFLRLGRDPTYLYMDYLQSCAQQRC